MHVYTYFCASSLTLRPSLLVLVRRHWRVGEGRALSGWTRFAAGAVGTGELSSHAGAWILEVTSAPP